MGVCGTSGVRKYRVTAFAACGVWGHGCKSFALISTGGWRAKSGEAINQYTDLLRKQKAPTSRGLLRLMGGDLRGLPAVFRFGATAIAPISVALVSASPHHQRADDSL